MSPQTPESSRIWCQGAHLSSLTSTPSLTTIYSFQIKLLTARTYPTFGLAVFRPLNILSWTHTAIISL